MILGTNKKFYGIWNLKSKKKKISLANDFLKIFEDLYYE